MSRAELWLSGQVALRMLEVGEIEERVSTLRRTGQGQKIGAII